jgi:hypothetical protein
MKQKLINLVRHTYGSSTEMDDIHEHNFMGNLSATVELYCVHFSYETVRGNNKERKIYFTPCCGWENVEDEFWKLIDNYNKENEHRKLSNVKILDSWLERTYNINL